MPAIYTSFEIEDSDSIEVKQKKLYLGMISCGEQAYTLGAAIAECRKQLTSLDETVSKIRNDFHALRGEVREQAKKVEELRKDVDSDDQEFHLIAEELKIKDTTREAIIKRIRELIKAENEYKQLLSHYVYTHRVSYSPGCNMCSQAESLLTK